MSGTSGPTQIDYTDSIEISPGLGGLGTALFETGQFLDDNVTVTGISLDGLNFTPVDPGSTASVNGFDDAATLVSDYFTIAVDSDGSILFEPNPDAATLIDDINANYGSATPLQDVLYYTTTDGTSTVTDQATFTLNDVLFNGGSSAPFTSPDYVLPGSSVSLAGLTVGIAPSDNGFDTADQLLSVTITSFNNNGNDQGTFSFGQLAGTSTETGSGNNFVIDGTQADINTDLSSLNFSASDPGDYNFLIQATDGPVQTNENFFGSVIMESAPSQVNDVYDEEISPGLVGFGGGIDGFSQGDTVVGISTDGVNFTPVSSTSGASGTSINGNYESFTIDPQGDSSVALSEDAQTLINEINANDATGTGPLTDTFYYEIANGVGTTVDSFEDTYGDVNSSAGLGYGQTETIAPGATIALPGFSVTKALSTDADGNFIASNPSVSIDISSFDYGTQQEDGTFIATTNVQGGGGTITEEANGSILISGLESEVNADLTSLEYIAGASGNDDIGVYTIDDSYANAPGYQSATYIDGTLLTEAQCFLAGTHIATADGEVLAEHLAIGDEILTADGNTVQVRWVGTRTIATRFAHPLRHMPVRILAGALGENTPHRDLLVSPCHAMFVGGILIQAAALVNGTSVVRETSMPERFTYYHIETGDHSLIMAENAAAETFVDNVDRFGFDNWAEYEELYGNEPTVEEMSHPRAKSARQIPADLRRMLAMRAAAFDAALSA